MATGKSTKAAREEVDAMIKGGSWPGESFLLGTFVSLPKPARVALYVVLLVVLLYTQILLPNLVTGRLVNEEDRGVVLPGSVSYWVNNHRSSTEIDERTGGWSLPLHSRLPRSLEVEVKVLRSKPQKVSIPFSAMLLARFSADPIEIRAKRLASTNGTDTFDLVVQLPYTSNVFYLLPSAFAQASAGATRTANSEAVLATARRIAKSADITSRDVVVKVFQDPFDQAALLHAIQANYEIYLPSTTLTDTLTIDQLATEVQNAVLFQSKVIAALPVALAKYQQRKDIWAAGNQPPEERLTNFIELHTAVPAIERTAPPLAFFDASLLGTGSQGMLFGKTGVYFRNDWTVSSGPRNGFIPYMEFAKRSFKKGAFQEVSLDGGQNFVVAGSGVSPKRLLELLADVQKITVSAASK